MHIVPVNHLSTALGAGAGVILTGALYAVVFAWARVSGRRRLMALAYLTLVLLVGAVALLVWTLRMTGFWAAVAAVMLVGYLLAPRAIWRLTLAVDDHPE